MNQEQDINNLFEFIDTVETTDYFSKEALIKQAKTLTLENKGEITLSETEGIKTGLKEKLKNVFKRKNIIYFGRMQSEFPIPIETATGKNTIALINDEDISKKLEKI